MPGAPPLVPPVVGVPPAPELPAPPATELPPLAPDVPPALWPPARVPPDEAPPVPELPPVIVPPDAAAALPDFPPIVRVFGPVPLAPACPPAALATELPPEDPEDALPPIARLPPPPLPLPPSDEPPLDEQASVTPATRKAQRATVLDEEVGIMGLSPRARIPVPSVGIDSEILSDVRPLFFTSSYIWTNDQHSPAAPRR